MQKNFLYLAIRYLFTKHFDASIKLITKICFIGILIATCSLALVISVMTGFEQATYQKMQSIYPDLIIETYQNPFDLHQLDPFCGPQGIAHCCTHKHAQVFLCNVADQNKPATVLLQGIVPHDEAQVSSIAQKIILPAAQPLQNLVCKDHIVIGASMAKNLNLEVGDQAMILYCDEPAVSLCMNFDHATVTIAGIFKTGIEELDTGMALCHQKDFDAWFKDHEIDQIHMKLNRLQDEPTIRQSIDRTLHCDVYSWKDLYPTLLSALKLEKYAMAFILFLIVLVASMNIIALINMTITQKNKDIAILLCYGMKTKDIKKIFISMSSIITTTASLCGLTCAWIIGKLLQTYPCIKLPDNIYDSDFLPVTLELSVFFVILIATILISVLASIFATAHVRRIKIISTLKS
jgi:lipoprotein-releasing system permease protein